MARRPELLKIDGYRAGWQAGTLVAFVLLPTVIAAWLRQTAGASRSSELAIRYSVLALLLGAAAATVNRIWTTWHLDVQSDGVILEQRGVFRTRRWTCERSHFYVGQIEVVEGSEGFDHFIGLRLSGRRVRFMRGCRDRDLRTVRAQIAAWRSRDVA